MLQQTVTIFPAARAPALSYLEAEEGDERREEKQATPGRAAVKP